MLCPCHLCRKKFIDPCRVAGLLAAGAAALADMHSKSHSYIECILPSVLTRLR